MAYRDVSVIEAREVAARLVCLGWGRWPRRLVWIAISRRYPMCRLPRPRGGPGGVGWLTEDAIAEVAAARRRRGHGAARGLLYAALPAQRRMSVRPLRGG